MSLLGPSYSSSDTNIPGGMSITGKSMDMSTGLPTTNPNDDPKDKQDAGTITYDELMDGWDSPEELAQAAKLNQIAPIVKDRKDRAMRARRSVTEPIWIQSYYAWRGQYSPAEREKIAQAQARNPGASEVYVKITKTKVVAAYGQLLDILLSNNKIPLEVKCQEVPDGVADDVYIAPPSLADAVGFAGDGRDVQPGETAQSLLGGLYSKYQSFIKDKSVVQGPSPDPKQYIEIDPASEAAANMQKMLVTQLEKGEFQEELRKVALESVMLGTGILKGPVTYTQTIHNWKKDDATGATTYAPVYEDIPRFYQVSIWNVYPDPDATDIASCQYVVERHLLHKHELKQLRNQPGFNKKAIDRTLRQMAKYQREYWETIIQDSSNYALEEERYEVLEYWGYLDKDLLCGLDGIIDKDDLAQYVDLAQVNIWVVNNEVIRCVLNPYTPQRIPYFAVPFETHPYQIWGIGIPENMSDTQMLMNGHFRMSIDNLRLSGNVMLEVNEAQLVPGQELALYPGKIFRKQGGAPGQSIYPISVTNTTQQHLMMVDKARQFMDEATGQSSLQSGQTGAQSGVRSAAQTSMLLAGATLNTKTVIRNFDHYLLRPVGEAAFAWNMQFNDDHPEIKGDLKIVSNGTAALMQKEVQSQRLMGFLQLTANPIVAPFISVPYIVKQIASSMDLDPDKVVNDPKAAAIMAAIMSQMNPQQGGTPPNQPQGAGPSDPSGGNPGASASPQPGSQGFTGNGPQPQAS